ncbi:uncharacterized protein LOC141982739 [Natator depressus]|uniref:uncharacterized protein LOC141982739 n=1 Tax=Natator depressus TaxID=27790 RepID=UPI003EBDA9A0
MRPTHESLSAASLPSALPNSSTVAGAARPGCRRYTAFPTRKGCFSVRSVQSPPVSKGRWRTPATDGPSQDLWNIGGSGSLLPKQEINRSGLIAKSSLDPLVDYRSQRGKLQVTMQSSSAEMTMMESQNRKRAPAWAEREVRDLIAVWGEESVLSELRSSFQNAKTFVKISQGMKDRGHNRDPKQCRMKFKELRQAYQKTRGANSRSGSEPKTCRFYDELHAILGGSATTTPAVLFDSFNGDGGNTEAGFGDEQDDDDDEVVDSSQQASGETGFPDSQEQFLTLDLEPVPPESTQGCLLDPAGGEGTSAACVSMITGSSPSQRLVKIRKKKNALVMKCSLSSCCPPTLTEHRRMRGGK